MEGKSYRDLDAWKEAMNLAEPVYRVTGGFPEDQKYSLKRQVQKSAVSVPSNIAEGHGRRSDGEFIYHCRVAYGSLCELDTQLRLARRLGYVSEPELTSVLEQLQLSGRLLNGLLRYLITQKQPT